MKFKDLLMPLVAALFTTWLIQHFILNRFLEPAQQEQVKSGASFVAPTSTQMQAKPLNLEINFAHTARSREAERTEIDTPLAHYVFSTDGATLEALTFKHTVDSKSYAISTIAPAKKFERENRCFLVALEDKTPYYFTLINKQEAGDTVTLLYQADFDYGILQKKFTIYKNVYKIVLDLAIITNKSDVAIEPRIFYPAPLMPELGQEAAPAVIATDEKGRVIKITKDSLDPRQGWYAPTLFGLENRYFVQAMVEDPQQAVKRAYVNIAGKDDLYAILETAKLTKENQYSLSFYFGPKQESAMVAVDPRLPQVLEYYGWFAPISRVMLAILNFLYEYVRNFGLAIIILTFAIRLLLLPFTIKGEANMKKRGELQKKLQYLRQRYKDEPETLAHEQGLAMKKYGGGEIAGCLPMLIQLPIAIGLQRILSHSIELYKAPFFGWITDLSARDPYYILPVLSGVCMVVAAPNEDYKQQIAVLMMAVLITVIIAKFSAGLTLYVCAYNVFSVIQKYVQKSLKAA